MTGTVPTNLRSVPFAAEKISSSETAVRAAKMGLSPSCLWGAALATALLVYLPAACAADADLNRQEAAVFAAAVERVAPAVVRIETVGGLERRGRVLLSDGPTTGLVVAADGYIVSSAFNFLSQPTSILVRLADGTRKPAKLVATDHARMIVLLKIDVAQPLPACEIAPQAEMRVGQWAIAVGRAFDASRPSMAVGIISAVNRVWGKAIQTDAAVSPNNYGGPLIDIRGRVLGVLVPLSPESADEMAGVEWYDSGVGFAIPVEHIQRVLARLKKGESLRPGMAGISLKGPNLYTAAPIVVVCRANSPAAVAGIKAGDRIVEIDGRKIQRAAEVREELGRRYAGEKMRVVVLRDQERRTCDVELAAGLPPYQHGFLGILPLRDRRPRGVSVRYVYPASPAEKAGIVAGDVLLSLGGKPIGGRMELGEQIGSREPGTEIELEFRHGNAARKVKVTLAALPEDLPPAELPPAHGDVATKAGAPSAPIGPVPLKVPEFANEAWAYVPQAAQAGVAQGILVWLHAPGGFDWQALLARCKPLCDRYDLILLAPRAGDPAKWMPGELGFVSRLLGEVMQKYPIDPARIVVGGEEAGGTLAFMAAFRNREAFRAVAAIDAAPTGQAPQNEPPYRLAIYSASASKAPLPQSIEASIAAMRKMKIPVTVKSLGEMPRSLRPDEWAELSRWIDMLDRI